MSLICSKPSDGKAALGGGLRMSCSGGIRAIYRKAHGVPGRECRISAVEALCLGAGKSCSGPITSRITKADRQYQIATITAEGIHISDAKSAETEWRFAEGLRGYGAQEQ